MRWQPRSTRDQVNGEITRFYYDTAQVANPITLAALVKLVPIAQIVYGPDFPYRTAADHTKGLDGNLQRQRSRGHRPRECAAAIAAPENGVAAGNAAGLTVRAEGRRSA